MFPLNPATYDYLERIGYPFLFMYFRVTLVNYKGSKE
ncbi:hypothetical protein HYO99_gp16 [Roseobacter phage RD-1410W1-01]|uniref:Uncharacterized protein n=1 Tax=Roseobacter phage RD-1410W1-01 TaxID=1815984 RepID=A0A191VYG5_9CAUD|nr:hypothetical protein HYO99_gp16 [Roseobacter phage RD-1410W1-01]ANJ20750.1 hypothetical protein RDp01_gp16 [Roseobacter phage RD-1410W1-01]